MSLGEINKQYFDFEDKNNGLFFKKLQKKPYAQDSAVKTLKKIENLLTKFANQEHNPNLEGKILTLMGQCNIICAGYKRETDKLGWFARKFFSKQKQVDEIHQRVVALAETMLKKIREGRPAHLALPVIKALNPKIGSFLGLKDLASLGMVSRTAKADADLAMQRRAKEYGYTGSSKDFIKWSQALYRQVNELAQAKIIPAKYIAKKNEKIDTETTIKNLQALTTADIFTILSHEKVYKGNKEFLSIFHTERSWKLAASNTLPPHILRTGAYALYLACKEGHLEIAKLLLERGVCPNVRDQYGTTVLAWACRHGHLGIVKLLLERGADLHKNNGKALYWACDNGHLEIAKLLLERGADPNVRDQYGTTALSEACRHGHLEIAKLLLERGADANAHYRGAFISACSNGHLEIVKLLLERGADPNGNGAALISACRHGHLEIVKLLLERGVDLEARPDDDDTALMWACRWRENVEIVRFLLESGAAPNSVGGYLEQGQTALHVASKEGNLKIVELLLEYKADPHLRDADNRRPIDSANEGYGFAWSTRSFHSSFVRSTHHPILFDNYKKIIALLRKHEVSWIQKIIQFFMA